MLVYAEEKLLAPHKFPILHKNHESLIFQCVDTCNLVYFTVHFTGIWRSTRFSLGVSP